MSAPYKPLGSPGPTPADVDPHGLLEMPEVQPGLNGLPFRGDRHETIRPGEEVLVKTSGQCHTHILDMSKPEDVKTFNDCWQAKISGTAIIPICRDQWHESVGTWKVFLVFVRLFTHKENPAKRG